MTINNIFSHFFSKEMQENASTVPVTRNTCPNNAKKKSRNKLGKT